MCRSDFRNAIKMNNQSSLAEDRTTTSLPGGHRGIEPRVPIQILKVLQCSNLGGMEQVAYSLLRDMTRDNSFRFRIATPRPFGKGETILRTVDPLCRDHEYKGKFGWRTFTSFRRQIRKLADESKHIWITGTCACSLAAVRDLPQKKVLGHHFHHFDDAASRFRWFGFYHALCRDIDAITYPTDFTRNEALTIAPWLRDRTHVVPHGYTVSYTNEETRLRDQMDARRALNLPTEAFIVGNAGWLIARKRFDVFLETASRIKQKLPRAFFVICGGGPLEKELKQRAAKLGISDSVRFTGWIDDPDTFYRAWDVCLFNSNFDALGRTPMEAASHGCLVAASVRYGGLSEFLTHDENGIFLTSHDADRLARHVVALAKNSTKASGMREAAAEKLRMNYSPERSLRFYRAIFS